MGCIIRFSWNMYDDHMPIAFSKFLNFRDQISDRIFIEISNYIFNNYNSINLNYLTSQVNYNLSYMVQNSTYSTLHLPMFFPNLHNHSPCSSLTTTVDEARPEDGLHATSTFNLKEPEGGGVHLQSLLRFLVELFSC